MPLYPEAAVVMREPWERRSADGDILLFSWLRHYGAWILVAAVVGAVVGGVVADRRDRRVESWTYVAQTKPVIAPFQLPTVARAVFGSPVVFRPILSELGVEGRPEDFLSRSVELRPIAGSNMLIVVGIADTRAGADRRSDVAARALVEGFRSIGYPDFRVTGTTRPTVSGSPTSTVLTVLGAAIGLFVGLALSIAHNRLRRPVLSLMRASEIASPHVVGVVGGRLDRWTSLRRWARRDDVADVVDEVVRTARNGATPHLVAVGVPRRLVRELREVVVEDLGRRRTTAGRVVAWDGSRWPGGHRPAGPVVLVCGPSTPEEDLVLAAGSDRPALLWLG